MDLLRYRLTTRIKKMNPKRSYLQFLINLLKMQQILGGKTVEDEKPIIEKGKYL